MRQILRDKETQETKREEERGERQIKWVLILG